MPTRCGAVECRAPAVSLRLTPWQADGAVRTLEQALQRVSDGFQGDWQGVVQTPWVAPYEVLATFRSDGGYSARCQWSSNLCCHALYYGTDDDAPLKRYTLDKVSNTGLVSGSIDIIFGTAGAYYESSYQGRLEAVQLDATGNRLRFEFWNGDQYGPVTFDLERVLRF